MKDTTVSGGIGNPTELELMCLARARLWESLIPFCQEFEELEFETDRQNRYGKQKRYKGKLVLAGRCPHCGKPCAPYFECEKRRIYKRAKAKGKTLVHKKSGNAGDRRFLPKRPEYDWRVVVAQKGGPAGGAGARK